MKISTVVCSGSIIAILLLYAHVLWRHFVGFSLERFLHWNVSHVCFTLLSSWLSLIIYGQIDGFIYEVNILSTAKSQRV